MNNDSLRDLARTLDDQFITELAQLRRTFVMMLTITGQATEVAVPQVAHTIEALQNDWMVWMNHNAHRLRM